ncbi:MAG TPA: tetratricopeptide repeat protein [Vicinamibacterales bacterium]|nr:tetratricopeptide repeat protein [Vicinamibacterales bacterium]
MRIRHLHFAFFLALTELVNPCAALAHAQGADPLAIAYTRLYEGQPEEAQERFDHLRRTDDDALGPWFGSLFVMMARMDYDDSLGPIFEQSVDSLIETASRRYGRTTQDSEALFYLAQAYLLRSTYRLNFDKGMWGAARDAAKSKGYAEAYIRRHPEHGDAYLALGLYNYYVDIAPTVVKVVRVLLLLPSGNRAEGVKQLERASTEGHLFAPFAETALADIHGSFEGRPDRALPTLERLVQRFPGNAEMRLELASMYLHPAIEDYTRAEQHYQAVRAAASSDIPRHLSQRHSAILGLASVRRNQWRIDEAISLLDDPIDSRPATPEWVMPNLLLRRANYKMLVNNPSAMDDARRVLADSTFDTWHKAARRQIRAIESHRRSSQAAVYAALLPSNRLVAEERFEEARAAYDAFARQHPDDWQVRYRLAYLDFARERYDAAAAGMQAIVAARSPMPGWLKAAALLNLAWVHDIHGNRAQAVRLYRQILDDYEDESPAGAARLGLIAPFKVPIQGG